jgi:hypothetical protein
MRFAATPSSLPIVGMTIRLDRDIDREGRCCGNIAVISVGDLPHDDGLICAECGRHRGQRS